MLKYELIENNDDFVSYRYYPEGGTDSGYITIRKKDKKTIDQKIVDIDEFKWYYFKMLHRIKEFIDNNKFEKSGIIAWY